MNLFISSWNAHSIPNHGVPNCLQQVRSRTTTIHPLEIPPTRDAVEQYRQQGGHLTDPIPFVGDPLRGQNGLCQERNRRFLSALSQGNDHQQLFSSLVNGDSSNFSTAVITFASITRDLVIYYITHMTW